MPQTTLPFTMRQRRRLCRQWGYGTRPLNDWGSGDLPAPFAEGDIVEYQGGIGSRMDGFEPGYYVVSAVLSIGEDDAWYCRVANDPAVRSSDRLHIIPVDNINWMASFRLVDTSDPDGLRLREEMLSGV